MKNKLLSIFLVLGLFLLGSENVYAWTCCRYELNGKNVVNRVSDEDTCRSDYGGEVLLDMYCVNQDTSENDGGNTSENDGGTSLGKLEGIGPWNVSDGKDVTEAGENLEGILSTVVGFLTILTGLWFVITFIVGGLNWATAGGDANKVDEAKKKMTNGAIGLIIVVAAYSIMIIISKVLGIDILSPSTELEKLNQ